MKMPLCMRLASFFVSMAMCLAWPVAMSNIVEEHKTNDVRCQSQTTNDQHKLRVRDVRLLDESLNGFQEDSDAERN